MFNKSPIFHWVCLASLLVSGVYSVIFGLMAFNYNLFELAFFKNPQVLIIFQYIVLAAGIVLLVEFFLKLAYGKRCCHCGNCPCTCNVNNKNQPYNS